VPESTSSNSAIASIDIRQLPWIRPLAAAYVHDFGAVSSFYAGDPNDPVAWRNTLGRVQATPRDRRALVDILARQQERRGAPLQAREAARRLLDPQTVAVVTGQQAGMLGGPLFTLLKALTAIRLAREVQREHGTAAVAVFWIDAEDHDWNEVASLTMLDADYRPRVLALPTRESADPVPVATIKLDPTIDTLLAELGALLPPTDFTAGLVDSLRAAYRPGAGMAEAFGRWLDGVLGPLGLILYDCSDPDAKPLTSHLVRRELEQPGRTWRLASDAGAELERQGFHAQVAPQPDGVALFYLNGGRHPIRRDGPDFVAGGERLTQADLLRTADQEPHRFSPNVLLRPLVQDSLFPTIAYVGGPSELAYLGQLKAVYEHFELPMPLVVPRATATLMDSAAARFMNKYSLEYRQLQAQDDGELNRLLESLLPPEVESSLQEARAAAETRMAAVIDAVRLLDPTLEGTARAALGKMEHELRALHGKVIHAAKKRDDVLRRQFTRTRALIFPNGQPQERTLGFVWFLNRYGPALVGILERDLPRDGSVHALLTP
jgi:bacillithiol biosynthesis cysteine-adding enzyme BshC